MGKLENAGDMSRRTLEVSSSGLNHPTSVYWTAFDWGSEGQCTLGSVPWSYFRRSGRMGGVSGS
jgi:hypothetical protein